MAVGHVTFLKLAAGLVILIASAVMHTRKESPSLRQQITIITSENVESLLSPYREVIGAYYQGYKNHVLRVISYTRHLLPDLATFTKNQKEIELALVYHDIGLWTDSDLSYLEPSLKNALEKAEDLHFSDSSKALVRSIILEHHKLLPYKGFGEEIVEAVRQADLVDFSFGIINHGIADRHIAEAYAALPESNFHLSLVRLLFTLQGYNIPKAVFELSKIFKI